MIYVKKYNNIKTSQIVPNLVTLSSINTFWEGYINVCTIANTNSLCKGKLEIELSNKGTAPLEIQTGIKEGGLGKRKRGNGEKEKEKHM